MVQLPSTIPRMSENLQGKVDELKLEKERLLLEKEIAVLDSAPQERVVQEAALYSSMRYADMSGRHWDEDPRGSDLDSYSGRSNPEDRDRGDNRPIWQTESELAEIRGACRIVSAINEVGIGITEAATNYTIGQGITVEIGLKGSAGSGAESELTLACQAVLDEFFERTGFICDADREIFKRAFRDGECFAELPDIGGGRCDIAFVEPDWITEPDAPRVVEDFFGWPSYDWKYGIASPWGRARRSCPHYGFFVSEQPGDWDVVASDAMLYYRRNVDRNVRRGLSDLYPCIREFAASERLLGNSLVGASAQAAIAYIRQYNPGTNDSQMRDVRSSLTAEAGTDPTTGNSRRAAPSRPGTVLDIKGADYLYGPLGQPQGRNYIEILQAGLRVIGTRWNMPEYMVSGDASNGNFASTLVAEAPFTKYIEVQQAQIINQAYLPLVWRVLAIASAAGRLPPIEVLRSQLSVNVTLPTVAVRNRIEEHTINQSLHDNGIMSKPTWAAKEGLDLDDERESGAVAINAATPAPPMMESIANCSRGWGGYP